MSFNYSEGYAPWHGMTFHYYSPSDIEAFDGYEQSRWTAMHWEFPLAAVALYLIMIPVLKALVKTKVEMRTFNMVWNASLSLFSIAGLCATAPVMLGELFTNGLYFTVCAPPSWYGAGTHGLFVALFIYSKPHNTAPSAPFSFFYDARLFVFSIFSVLSFLPLFFFLKLG